MKAEWYRFIAYVYIICFYLLFTYIILLIPEISFSDFSIEEPTLFDRYLKEANDYELFPVMILNVVLLGIIFLYFEMKLYLDKRKER